MDKSKRNVLIITSLFLACIFTSIIMILNYVSGKNADKRVVAWWMGITLISILNFYLWSLAYLQYKKKSKTDTGYKNLRKMYPGLSLAYVIVCAFRSFLPRAYVARTVIVDSWWSNVFLARLGATFAEICFIILIALYLKEVSKNLDLKRGTTISRIIVPAICIAQCFSWMNVITKNNFFAILEESIWGIMGILLFIATIPMYSRVELKYQKLIIFLCLCIIVYVIFMFTNDVPKYISRFIADQESGKIYFTFSEGINDLLTTWNVSHKYVDWVNEMLWLALYFSTAVWGTIYLINAPEIKKKE